MTNLPKDILEDTKAIIYKFEFSDFDFDNIDDGQPFTLDYEAGDYRQKDLVSLLFKVLPYFALTEKEFKNYNDKSLDYTYEKAIDRIVEPDIRAGDYGEIALFLILEIFYKSDKLVTKVKYKTPGKMPVFGSDVAHFTENKNGNIVLWFGEAKFYKDFSGALINAFDSVSNFLKSGVRKELRFLTPDKIEINKKVNAELNKKVLAIVDSKISLDKLIFKIPVLIMYEHSKLCKYNDIESEEFKKNLKIEFKEKFNKIKSKKWAKKYYKNLSFVFFLLPLQDIKKIKESIKSKDDERRS